MSVSITTVGYGYVTPVTDGGKIFFIFFIITGLSIIGYSLGVFLDFVADCTKLDRIKPVHCLLPKALTDMVLYCRHLRS